MGRAINELGKTKDKEGASCCPRWGGQDTLPRTLMGTGEQQQQAQQQQPRAGSPGCHPTHRQADGFCGTGHY